MSAGTSAPETAAVPQPWKGNAALFMTGQTVSLFGSMVVQYAVMWYVTLETGSGLAVALYAVAAFLPQGVISIFGGTFADRVNRRLLVIVSDSTTALATLALAILMMQGVTDLWVILVAVAVRSVGAGFQQPTVQAMIPQIVPSDQLMRVNGIFQTLQSVLALVAPAAAGAVYGLMGIVPVFFIDVVTALVGVGLLFLVKVPTLQAVADKTTGFREDLVEGARFIWNHGLIRWLMLVFAVGFFLTGAPGFVTPLLITREWGDDVWLLTVLELAFSIGMLAGGVLISTVLSKLNSIGLVIASAFGFGLFSIGLGVSPELWVFYAFMFGFGLMVPLFSAPLMTSLQQSVPPEKQGRVFSYVSIVMALSVPIAMTAFGPLSDSIGVRPLLIGAGIAYLAFMVLASIAPSGRAALRSARKDEVPLADAEPAAEVDAPTR